MLYDYCIGFIEDSNASNGEGVNGKIYSLCCDYILGACNDSQRQRLIDFFKLNIV